jgi:hypothetical protein
MLVVYSFNCQLVLISVGEFGLQSEELLDWYEWKFGVRMTVKNGLVPRS